MNSGGILKPHQLGGTDPDIVDTNRSVVSLVDSSDVDGLASIGVDCALVTPNVLGGTTFSIKSQRSSHLISLKVIGY